MAVSWGGTPAWPPGSRWRESRFRWRLDEHAEVGLPATGKHRGARLVAQRQDSGEIGAAGLDRLADVDRDRRPARQPLIAAQHGAGTADGAREHREPGIARDLEGPEEEFRQAGSAGE